MVILFQIVKIRQIKLHCEYCVKGPITYCQILAMALAQICETLRLKVTYTCIYLATC